MTVTPAFLQLQESNGTAVREELAAGLRKQPASVSPKFLYDALGSRLFSAITELPEYYPTRTEAAIFAAHGANMARQVSPDALMLDLGAGCCAKAARLFPVLQPAGYVAVDISVDFLRDTLVTLQQRHPALPMLGLGLDFSSTLTLPDVALPWLAQHRLENRPRVVFYPGSSIGNFSPPEALRLLRQAHAVCQAGGAGGGLLIGVDRVKPVDVLEPAYDDSLGVTAAFNRNLLLHANHLLGTDFQPRQWTHVALYHTAESRIEMHLESAIDQAVRWPGGERHFVAGERLHTENSYKWTPEAFSALLEQAGFRPTAHWTDERAWFSVFWAVAQT